MLNGVKVIRWLINVQSARFVVVVRWSSLLSPSNGLSHVPNAPCIRQRYRGGTRCVYFKAGGLCGIGKQPLPQCHDVLITNNSRAKKRISPIQTMQRDQLSLWSFRLFCPSNRQGCGGVLPSLVTDSCRETWFGPHTHPSLPFLSMFETFCLISAGSAQDRTGLHARMYFPSP